MKAAIYARFSTDMQRDESIDDQVRVCRNRAQHENLEVVEIFADKGLSGSKTDRPGYQSMLAAARAGQFDVILCEDVSRLWRDEVEQPRCVRELLYLNKHVIGVTDGIDTRREGFEYLLAIKGAQNAAYRREIGKRTHRGLAGNAARGAPAGGRSYGLRPISMEITDPKTGRRRIVTTGREIVPEEKVHVLESFERYADGQSTRRIAAEFNRLGMPSPGASWRRKSNGKRRDSKWLASTIHGDPKKGTGILNNELYIGRQVWNRSHWVERPDGKRERRERPESEWIITEHPELRIVPQELWDRVKARQKSLRAKHESQVARMKAEGDTCLRGPRKGQARLAEPRYAPPQKYLFSGLLKCAQCGANYVMISRYQYGCSSYINGGLHACGNKLRVARTLVEELLLDGIKNKLFSPKLLAEYEREAARLLQEEKRRQHPDTEKTRAALAGVERDIENLLAAIKVGILTPSTKAELEKAECERAQLLAASNVNTRALDRVADALPEAAARYRTLVTNLAATAQRDVVRARAQVTTLVSQVLLHPTDQGHLEAKMTGNPAGLIKLALDGTNLNWCGSGGRI